MNGDIKLDIDLIKAVANEIVNQSIIGNYKTYLVIIAISLVTGSLSAFLASYLKIRGKYFATKNDFNQILSQLEETTKITEEIKSGFNARVQDENNIKALNREKLERIFSETFELELWFERARSKALKKELPDTNESPIAKIEMYQAIYFKEVETEISHLKKYYYPMIHFILDVAGQDIQNHDSYMVKFKAVHNPLLDSLNKFRDALVEKYASKFGL